MTYTAFVIDGTRRTFQESSLSVKMSATAPTVMSADVLIPGASWRPALGDEVALWMESNAIGTARSFNGSSSVLSRSFSSGVTDDFTLGVWAKASSTSGTQGLAYAARGSTNGYGIRISGGTWQLHYPGVITTTGAAPATGTWEFLTIRRSGGTGQLYINGVASGSTTALAPVAPNGYLSVGAMRDSSNAAFQDFFSGDIGPMFLAHSALTVAQIAAIASGGPAGTGLGADRILTGTYWYYPIRGEVSPEPDSAASTSLAVTSAPQTLSGPLVIGAGADILVAGEIDNIRERGAKDKPVDDLLVTISASDFSVAPDRIYQHAAFDAGTLEDQLIQIVTTLGYGALMGGVTLASDQPTGPNVEAVEITRAKLIETFNRITLATGYVWRINELKELSFRLPSSVSAPFNITESNRYAIEDVSVETSLSAGFTNWVWVDYGNGISTKSETFTGDGVEDQWALAYDLVAAPRGYVVVNGSTVQTLSVDTTGGAWEVDTSSNILTRAAGALPNGDTVELEYQAQFPASASAGPNSDGYPLIEHYEHLKDEFDAAVADAYADDVLAARNVVTKLVTYTTTQHGLRPGQLQNINLPDRNINEDCVIADVSVSTDGPTRLRYSVTASTDGVPVSWREALKR